MIHSWKTLMMKMVAVTSKKYADTFCINASVGLLQCPFRQTVH
jgi:hypothetical protein